MRRFLLNSACVITVFLAAFGIIWSLWSGLQHAPVFERPEPPNLLVHIVLPMVIGIFCCWLSSVLWRRINALDASTRVEPVIEQPLREAAE